MNSLAHRLIPTMSIEPDGEDFMDGVELADASIDTNCEECAISDYRKTLKRVAKYVVDLEHVACGRRFRGIS